MIDGEESETVLLIEKAFIHVEVGSIITGKFSYVVIRVSSLFSLVLETVGIAKDVRSKGNAIFFYDCFDLIRLVGKGS